MIMLQHIPNVHHFLRILFERLFYLQYINQYIVEIISKDSDLYIHKNDSVRHFLSVNDAISNAQKYGAKEFFLCVDNTYDECGSMDSRQQFDYIPIHSKIKGYKN